MKLRLSNRVALLAAAGVVASALGVAYLPSTTYALSPHALSAGNFHEIALQGFGDPENSWAWSMAYYKGRLYVGDNRAYICAVDAMFNRAYGNWFPYPPAPDPNMTIQCNPDPQALPEAGQIWSVDPSAPAITQTNWTKLYESPYTVTVNITQTNALTQAARDIGFRDMSVYDDGTGPALFVSGVGSAPLNGKKVPPPSLLRYTGGYNQSDWQPVPADPGTTMGDINLLKSIPHPSGAIAGGCCIRSQAQLPGHFFITIGSVQGSGAVFASTNPAAGDNSFVQLTPPNMLVFEMETFNGHLYLGLQSSKGYTVVRTDCFAPPVGQKYCPANAFKQVVPPGGGLGSKGNGAVTSMHVFKDPNGVQHLYVGTDSTDGIASTHAAEIVRVNTDDSWDLIVGDVRIVGFQLKEPLSGMGSGFGSPYNIHMWRMEDYQGVLYVGTNNDYILQYGQPGFQLGNAGFQLWASTDGIVFQPVTQNGFGDPFSYGARTLQATPNGLFVGSANHYQGLRIWQGSLSQASLNLMPGDLQLDSTGSSSGNVALSWNAPSADPATLYHVYRADYTRRSTNNANNIKLHRFEPVGGMPLRAGTRSVWELGTYTEIGSTTTPYFVDHSATAGGHYSYYVVAQDALDNLSAPSNVVEAPTPLHLPTFHDVHAMVWLMALTHKMTAAQATQIYATLKSARQHLL